MSHNVGCFPNLRAEMGGKGIGIVDLAASLGVNRNTLTQKLSGRSEFTLREVLYIQEAFFPGCDISYLFARERKDRSHA